MKYCKIPHYSKENKNSDYQALDFFSLPLPDQQTRSVKRKKFAIAELKIFAFVSSYMKASVLP